MPVKFYIPPCDMSSDFDPLAVVPEKVNMMSVEIRRIIKFGRPEPTELITVQIGQEKFSCRKTVLLDMVRRLDGKEP